ncbi:hypothetical protein [Dactylosporangium sp. CA-233914]|uniref:hypothetical protein n=1 Tax=Dactylosporangium sp. CA-233914 TaxID=3239934 RepID=UPI003D92949C
MRVKVSMGGALYKDEGRLYWAGPAGARCAITPRGEAVPHWFATWRDLDSVLDLGEPAFEVARHLNP